MKTTHVTHPFAPICDNNSRLLILGSFPSVKSRENAFYYGHAQNRFWKVLSAVYETDVPCSTDEKTLFLKSLGIAVWDVIKSCDIQGSSDSSIRNVIPNDIGALCADYNISKIYANGKTAERLYNKYVFPSTKAPITPLPSTSPANAAYTLEKLTDNWRIILF